MLAIAALSLLLLEPPSTGAAAQAEAYGFAGDEHRKRAATTTGRPLDELQKAHTAYDSAYLVLDATAYLCRALDVAELALRTEGFADEHERQWWHDTRTDDLERLREQALQTGRGNCRYDATGQPAQPRVPLITPEDPPTDHPMPTAGPPGPVAAARTEVTPPGPDRTHLRRARAHTAMGIILTGTGLGLLGAFTGVLDHRRRRADELAGLIAGAEADARAFTRIEEQRYFGLVDELRRGKAIAIGVGVAGLVSLGTGVALLATRKHARARKYALQPYGGSHGVGATLRLRF